jgi:nicotinate-nucleotide adenylyltransferase
MIVGVLGGTFDPPHVGHLDVATLALEAKAVDEVWIVPCLEHRFGKKPAPFPDRMAMCRLLAASDPRLKVSDVEARLNRPGYTLDLIQLLQRDHPGVAFRLIAGSDIYHEKDKWHRYDEVAALAPPVFIERAGERPIPHPTLGPAVEVSSSELREALISGERTSHLIPRAVLAYIDTHGLYEKPRDD